MIQAVTFSFPSWRSLNNLKGSRFHHPKKGTLNHQVCWILLSCFRWFDPIKETPVVTSPFFCNFGRPRISPGRPKFFWGGVGEGFFWGKTFWSAPRLGGGFKDFLFSPQLREMIQFEDHMFHMAWNHQLQKTFCYRGWCCPVIFVFFLDYNRRREKKDPILKQSGFHGMSCRPGFWGAAEFPCIQLGWLVMWQ